jgi:hypothetical protein
LKKGIVVAVLLNLAFQTAHAGHPLVTDDTGTQGQRNHQIEVNTDRLRFENIYSSVGSFAYTYGLRETLDVFIDMPYTFTAPRGANDVVLGAKWRFWGQNQVSLALKPEILLPTGDENEDLGNGRTGYTVATLATYEAAPWAFHANVGIAINRYLLSEVADSNHRITWHTSAAVAYAVNDRWQLVGETGIERNPDKESTRHPAFMLAGLIYSPSPQLDLDLGVKVGLGAERGARQLGAGLTFSF